MNCQWSFHLHAQSKTSRRRNEDIRNGWLGLYFVEALGKKSVNWPLPVLAPPSQCNVAVFLHHDLHCQQLTATSLLFPRSGWRATRYHPLYSTEQPREKDSPRDVCIELQVSLYVKDIQCGCSILCVSVPVWPFTHPRSLDQVSDQIVWACWREMD